MIATRYGAFVVGVLAASCSAPPSAPAAAPRAAHPPAVDSVAPAVPAAAPAQRVPEPDQRPVKSGDDYTVWGLGSSLRIPEQRESVTREPITVTGFIVATNLGSAPACAVHAGGIADPEDCTAPVPAFWLGDRPDSALGDCVKVMGFASNYAQLYDAIHAMDRGEQVFDTFWGMEIPNPLPAIGARVTVAGQYGTTFSMTTTGGETDETMGILTFRSMQTLEPATELATLPGVKRNPQP